MKTIKKLWGEFKKFISRGNVLDLAVAVVIGAAFTAIVNSLTNDIIMPLINWAVGDGDFHARCLERIQFLQNNGVTLILVSHNSNEIETFCSRCWHLEDGVAVLQPCGRNRKNGNGG